MSTKCSSCQHDNPSDSKFCSECGSPIESVHTETETVKTRIKDAVIGEIISDKYRLLEEIGSGGMGIVYKAEQIRPVKRNVALKIIKLGMDTKQVVARFESERQALAVMNHPNIAKVFDGGATETGRPYFVMELVRGIPITEYCDKHKLTTKERLELFIRVCQAIQHAHQKGVIHRDLKPSNVLVVVEQEKPVPKVIDFGIAKATEHRLTERTLFTEQGQLMGTPEYMSPEQAEMSGLDVDTRTDIYSLGVMLYELLVGVLPFDSQALRSAGFAEIQRIIREIEPDKPSTRLSKLGDTRTAIADFRRTDALSLQRQIRGDLDWILMKSMEKDRTRRYETANALAMDLKRHIDQEPILARPPSAVYKATKFMKRHKMGIGAGLLVVTALVIGLVLATTGMMKARRAEAAAAGERDRAQVINDFLQKMLASPDPYKEGRDVKVIEVLDNAAKSIGEDFTDQPETAAALRATLARTYQGLGELDKSNTEIRLALDLQNRALGPDHPDTVKTKTMLAEALNDQGKFTEAEAIFLETLPWQRKTLGPEHKETVNTMYYLAIAQAQQGKLKEAEALLRETMETEKRILDPENPDILVTMNALAVCLRNQGKYEESEALQREALERQTSLIGLEHPNTLITMSGLANTLDSQGKYQEAESMFREIWDIELRVFGEEHPQTLNTVSNLANCLKSQARYKEAEELHRDALEKSIRIRGAEHPYTLFTISNIALIIDMDGRPQEAEPLYREAISKLKRVLGPDHPATLDPMNNLAGSLNKLGRFREAEPLARETWEIRKKVLGEEHPKTLTSKGNLGIALGGLGKNEEAEALLRATLEMQKRILNPDHADITFTIKKLAEILEKIGKNQEAADLRRQLEEMREKKNKAPQQEQRENR